MSHLVNIGLHTRDGGTLSPEEALATLRVIGGVHTRHAEVRQSDSEPTLVAEVDRPLYATAAYEVANALRQDAIAVWDGREGQLYGPNAVAWGDFNPAFFLNLDGSRLEPLPLAKAA